MSELSIREMIQYYVKAKVAEAYAFRSDTDTVLLDCGDPDVFVLVSQYLMFQERCATLLSDESQILTKSPDKLMKIQIRNRVVDFRFEIFERSIKVVPHTQKQFVQPSEGFHN
ncbi:hypothetical protein KKG46_00790 [Patescibacteria group bacterium]|nr:hypothetical protein [Patescibacteria group bacterium]